MFPVTFSCWEAGTYSTFQARTGFEYYSIILKREKSLNIVFSCFIYKLLALHAHAIGINTYVYIMDHNDI